MKKVKLVPAFVLVISLGMMSTAAASYSGSWYVNTRSSQLTITGTGESNHGFGRSATYYDTWHGSSCKTPYATTYQTVTWNVDYVRASTIRFSSVKVTVRNTGGRTIHVEGAALSDMWGKQYSFRWAGNVWGGVNVGANSSTTITLPAATVKKNSSYGPYLQVNVSSVSKPGELNSCWQLTPFIHTVRFQ